MVNPWLPAMEIFQVYPSQSADKFVVRLPDGMRAQIKARAKASHRTMNSFIVHVIDRALAAEKNESPAATGIAPGSDHQQPLEKADEQFIA